MFKLSQIDDFKKSIDLTPILSRTVYFHFTNINIIDLTRILTVFYQNIFQHILKGNFVLNKGIQKETFLGLVTYDKIYMYVVFLFIFLPYVCPFLKIWCWTIYWWLCKQSITWLRRNVRIRKAEKLQSDIAGYYPRSKLPFRGIHDHFRLLIQWTVAFNKIVYTMQHDCSHFVY